MKEIKISKVTCQACGETDQVNNDSNLDTSTKFFVWPSHTDHTGLNIYAFFCFSCGSINAAAPDVGNLKYFITFKLDKPDLKKWCINKSVDQMIMNRLTTAGYL